MPKPCVAVGVQTSTKPDQGDRERKGMAVVKGSSSYSY